jgi:hypothetical protein
LTSLSKYHLAAVIWDDAHHSLDEYTLEEIDRNFHKAARTINYGLLIRDDETGITLTSEEDEDGDLRHVFFIPRKMIIEVVDLGVPKRKKARKRNLIPPS